MMINCLGIISVCADLITTTISVVFALKWGLGKSKNYFKKNSYQKDLSKKRYIFFNKGYIIFKTHDTLAGYNDCFLM